VPGGSVIADEVDGSSSVLQDVPPVETGALAAHENDNACVRFASGALVTYAIHRDEWRAQAPYLDKLYPGLKEMVEGTLSNADIATLNNLEDGSLKFEAYLSRFGQSVKSFCLSR
jgi:hypothetical protein